MYREVEFRDQRISILEKLKQISKPKNEYQIDIPELEEEKKERELSMDAEDVKRLEKHELLKKINQQQKLNSLAV